MLVAAAAVTMSRAAESNINKVNSFSEVELGPVPDPVVFITTPDGRHVAYTAGKDKQRVYFDGKPGPEQDGVMPLGWVGVMPLTFRPDGTGIAYVMQKKKTYWAVVDGQPGPKYGKIGGIVFSPDGKHTAYAAVVGKLKDGGDKWAIVVDGKESARSYVSISYLSPVFSPDGEHVVYVARKGDKAVVVVDGEEGPAYDKIGRGIPFFSPDGKHMAYTARNLGSPDTVILDGQPGPQFANVPEMSLLFSPDSRRLAYGAENGYNGEKKLVVVDGQLGPEYDQVDNLTFSPDGKHLAYKAQMGGRWRVVVDNQPGVDFDELLGGFPVFSPDGSRLAYGIKKDGKWQAVVDEAPDGGIYEEIIQGSMVFSSDSRRMAYTARIGDKKMVVVDGAPDEEYNDVEGNPVFSPDGKHLAYKVQKGALWHVVLDGQAGPGYKLIPGNLTFSKDSKHLAYAPMTTDEKFSFMVDGQTGTEPYKTMPSNAFLPTDGNGFEGLAVRGDTLYLLQWTP